MFTAYFLICGIILTVVLIRHALITPSKSLSLLEAIGIIIGSMMWGFILLPVLLLIKLDEIKLKKKVWKKD